MRAVGSIMWCWALGAGCWVLGAGCWVLGAGCWVLTAHITCSEDITEGKFSFLAIYAIHNNPGDHRLLNILKQRTDDVDKKLYALAYLRESVRGPFSVGLSTRVPTRRRVLCVRRALSSTPVLCFVTSRPRL